jgi:hypothetical protein
MGEKWFEFVKRIQSEEKKKGKNISFKEAMSVASDRKSEWKRDGSSSDHSKSSKSKSKKVKKGGKKRRSGTKKNRKSKSRM